MLIESIIRREGGTHITLGEETYSFLPDESGRHVCDVKNRDHIGRLLAIREGYRLADEEAPIDLPDVDVSQAEVIQPSGEAQEDDEAEDAPADDDRDAWVEKYEQKFGRKPHYRWTVERIRAEIEAE